MKSAFAAGLLPIVCVGETLAERESGMTFKVVEKQVREGVSGPSNDHAKTLVIAYEPVWAIGTGKTATSAQAQEVHAFIRKLLSEIYGKEISEKIRVLYGGSVKPDNISELMGQPDIDGGLVGGASLEADSFTKLVLYK
jgi:triosephosphate isomerase